MAFHIENIEQIITAFYKNYTEEANTFLTKAQFSKEAWQFCWMLMDKSKPETIQFFGAITLHTKIIHHWKELDSSQHRPLLQKIIEYLLQYLSGPKLIASKLCHSVSNCLIWLTLETDFDKNIQSVATSLEGMGAQETFFEIMIMLPDEFEKLQIAKKYREAACNELRKLRPSILNMMQHTLVSSTDKEMLVKSFKAFGAWSSSIFNIEHQENVFFITAAFQAIKEESLRTSALEALVIYYRHPSLLRMPTVAFDFIVRVLEIEELAIAALERKDRSFCHELFVMILEGADSFSSPLVDFPLQKPEMQSTIYRFFNLILRCTGAPGYYPTEETCSELPFTFWFSLQDEIVNSQNCFEQLLKWFNRIFHSLIEVYMRKVCYPPDEMLVDWSIDEKESFRCYRLDIADSLMYCYNILHEQVLVIIMSHLKNAMKEPFNWQKLEGCIYAISTIASMIDSEHSESVTEFFGLVQHLKIEKLEVALIFIETMGNYSEWINNHPEFLEPVIERLISFSGVAELLPNITMAFKEISRDCKGKLIPFTEPLLPILITLRGNANLREKGRIMETVGFLLASLPHDSILQYLDQILTPLLQETNKLATSNKTNDTLELTLTHLRCIASLFDSLNIEEEAKSKHLKHPVLTVLEQILPLFHTLHNSWNVELVDDLICEVLKKALGTLQHELEPVLSTVMPLLLFLKQSQNTLGLSKKLIILFALNGQKQDELYLFYCKLAGSVLSSFNAENLQESTEMIEAYFQLETQIFHKVFRFAKMDVQKLETIFNLAILSLPLPEKFTSRAVTQFIVEFINKSRECPHMVNIVNRNGQRLLQTLLRMVSLELGRFFIEYAADILLALNKKYSGSHSVWLHQYLRETTSPLKDEHEKFVKLVIKERANKRRLKEIVTDFYLVCRGIQGTEYAINTTSNQVF